MNDTIQFPIIGQPAQDTTSKGTSRQVDVALVLSESVRLDRPQVTVFLTVPTSLRQPLGDILATGRSTPLDIPWGRVVEAGPSVPTSKPFYASTEAARVLGMSVEEVEWWVEAGLIPARRARGQVLINGKWLDRYRPTAEATKWMGVRLSSDELLNEIRLGRRPWVWPTPQQVREA